MIEKPEIPEAASAGALAKQSRRDFLAFTAGTLATLVGAWWLLPEKTKARLTTHDPLDTVAARTGREKLLNGALTFDDDVAEALYSRTRKVRTYAKHETTPLKPNYHGLAPLPQSLAGWALTLDGLASGQTVRLDPAGLAGL